MATTLTTTTNFDQTVVALVLRMILENMRKRTHWLEEGAWQKARIIPGTNLLRYISYGDLSSDTQGLTEGDNAATLALEEALTIGYDEFACDQFGRLVGISDIALVENPHELMSVAAERVAWNALETLDRNVGDVIEAFTGNDVQVTGTTRVEVPQNSSDYGSANLVRQAVTQMRAANVPTFPDGYYHGIVHPYVAHDLMTEAATITGAWIDVRKYGGPDAEDLLRGEVGRIHGVRFMESNQSTYLGAVGAASAHLFGTVIYGPDYYVFGDEQSTEAYVVRPGGDHYDPLAQKALVGWKGMWGSKVIDDSADATGAQGPRMANIITSSSFAQAG